MSIASARAALLAVVAEDREARCQALAARAESAANAMLRTVRAELAGELRAHRADVLARGHAERAAADARWQAALRTRTHRLDAAALAAAWAHLGPALQERWRDEATRHRWLDRAIAHAIARLPASGWEIRVAPPWSAADAQRLRAHLANLSIDDVRCVCDDSLDAGVEIRAGDARVDATTDGLLADRPTIEGRLLAPLAPDRVSPS